MPDGREPSPELDGQQPLETLETAEEPLSELPLDVVQTIGEPHLSNVVKGIENLLRINKEQADLITHLLAENEALKQKLGPQSKEHDAMTGIRHIIHNLPSDPVESRALGADERVDTRSLRMKFDAAGINLLEVTSPYIPMQDVQDTIKILSLSGIETVGQYRQWLAPIFEAINRAGISDPKSWKLRGVIISTSRSDAYQEFRYRDGKYFDSALYAYHDCKDAFLKLHRLLLAFDGLQPEEIRRRIEQMSSSSLSKPALSKIFGAE